MTQMHDPKHNLLRATTIGTFVLIRYKKWLELLGTKQARPQVSYQVVLGLCDMMPMVVMDQTLNFSIATTLALNL